MQIDLNCDMGESFGVYRLGHDTDAMPLITSANVACGFHASDPMTMRNTVNLAKKYGVAVGAHPSFPDRVGFGRRTLDCSREEIKADVLYQAGSLWAFCRSEQIKLHHVKVHGALYNAAAHDFDVAVAVAEAIRSLDTDLYMVCLSNSMMVKAAEKTGVAYVEEVFADRAYTGSGTLVPRNDARAIIHDPDMVADRVFRMVKEKMVVSVDGTSIPVKAETICVHADTPKAVSILRSIRARLEREKVVIKTFGS